MSVESVFNSFCSFGAGKDGAAMMDNAKFAKFFRDLKLLDKKLTSTDIDIIFNRPEVKPKTERKINFAQFQIALKLVAEKKYPGDAKGLKKLEDKIISGKGPGTSSSTKAASGGIVERLTDTSKYTGSHKERFDESGKGRGLEGRDSPAKGRGMVPGSVASQASYVSGYKPSSSPKVASSRIVEKLTDTSKYTGSHKERFDGSGRGRGLEGRDSPAKGQGMSPGSVASHASYVSGYKHEGTYGKKK